MNAKLPAALRKLAADIEASEVTGARVMSIFTTPVGGDDITLDFRVEMKRPQLTSEFVDQLREAFYIGR